MSLVMTDCEQAVEDFSQPKIPVSASNSLLNDELMSLNSNASFCIRRKTEFDCLGVDMGDGGGSGGMGGNGSFLVLFVCLFFSARPAAPYITI